MYGRHYDTGSDTSGTVRISFIFRHSSDAALFSPPLSVPQPQQNNGT